MTKFISIISATGGTGKTTIAVNLALALSHFGKDVTLLDANLHAPNINYHLGFPHLPINLHDVLENKQPLEKSIYLHPSGLKVIPGSLSLRNVDERHFNNFKQVFNSLIGKTEIAIIDCPPGLTNDVQPIITNSDESIVVLNQHTPSVFDAKKVIAGAESQGNTIIGCIINRYNKNSKPDMYNAMLTLGKPILSAIPFDKHIVESLEAKHPVFLNEPRAKSSIEFEKLASLLNINETF